jgi:hypothetical protein
MAFLYNSDLKLLLVQETSQESGITVVKGIVALPPSQHRRIKEVVYYISSSEIMDFEDYDGELQEVKSPLNQPVILTMSGKQPDAPEYIQAIVVYKDGRRDYSEAIALDLTTVPTVDHYLTPSRIFIDEKENLYTITIADPYIPESDNKTFSYDEAVHYCNIFNRFEDNWKLPDLNEIDELYPLYVLGISRLNPSGEYWLSERDYDDEKHRASAVEFATGIYKTDWIVEQKYARPIRRNYFTIETKENGSAVLKSNAGPSPKNAQ